MPGGPPFANWLLISSMGAKSCPAWIFSGLPGPSAQLAVHRRRNAPVPKKVRNVVFVDGVRTPFGRAGAKGIYHETRSDDLVISCIRELMRRNPSLPAERVDEVALAATTQIGDQGLTIG